MREEWKSERFKDCIEKVAYTSKVQRKDFLVEGKFPVISQETEFVNGKWDIEADLFKVLSPVVLFGDHTRVIKYVDFDFVLGADGVKILQPREFLRPKFFYYRLQSINLKTLGYARHYRLLKDEDISYPSLPEQQRIVAILDEAFESIATAKAIAEKNLKNARALFDSYLSSVFVRRGAGWEERLLGDENLLEIIDGDRGINYPKASDFHDEGYCLFLNTKNVRPDGFVFDSTMFITKEKDQQLRKGKLQRDDVVLTTRGTIGNIGFYSDDVPFENIRINSGMLIFRPNKALLLSSYLFELLRSEIITDQIKRQTTGAAQPQLPIKTIIHFTIPVNKSLEEQRYLVNKIREVEPEIKHLESIYRKKIAALDALKKSILHKAFSGEL